MIAGWSEANQRYLMACLSSVRQAVARYAGQSAQADDIESARQALPAPAALDTLCETFGLSAFERDVVLLCAGTDLDGSFAALCGAGQPTFSLALAALPGAHWSAITPSAPLRYWHLIEVAGGDSLTRIPLRIDERVLHYLTGISYVDARLHGVMERVTPAGDLPPSHRACAVRLASLWSAEAASTPPVIQLMGDTLAEKPAVAAAACESVGLQLYSMSAAEIPPASDRELLGRLWDRESLLGRTALLIDWDDADNKRALIPFVESLHGFTLIAAREPLPLRKRRAMRIEVERPSTDEQRMLWQGVLGAAAMPLNGALDEVVSQFRLGMQGIQAAGAETRARLGEGGKEAGAVLWDSCRAQSRTRLEGLAQRLEAVAGWDDLVLPETQVRTLHEIALQVRYRAKVYETWGFAARGTRGLGFSALFSGASGTGKTMAAEVIARDLRMDLYRIDLSQVMSKYIGETEKNLQRVFDAAEESGAVLLFDEADALFGKRSEVKDSHDRYANIEISYLLQRMEAYRGLAILTTNMKTLLDPAFLRRIRFSVQFPFPELASRLEIWRRAFPARTPTDGVDAAKLANLSLAGGNIRNIAMQAAFLAAAAGEPVRMGHLLRAARSECAKLERPLSEAESRGWV